jgi:hypothetical protein
MFRICVLRVCICRAVQCDSPSHDSQNPLVLLPEFVSSVPVRKASSDGETNRAGSDCDTRIVAHRMRLLEIDRILSNEIKFRSILESDSRYVKNPSRGLCNLGPISKAVT